MKELKEQLRMLGLIPKSGYGNINIVWEDNEMVEILTTNKQLPKYIN